MCFEQVLADIEVDGRPRQVLLTIGKPGIIWALDRRTGEFLWERETSYQTVYKHIDAETGQVAINDSLIPQKLDETKFVCPPFYGGAHALHSIIPGARIRGRATKCRRTATPWI